MRKAGWGLALVSGMLLSACAGPGPLVVAARPDPAPLPAETAGPMAPDQAAATFLAVVDRVEPVAEALCAQRTRGVDCDITIVVDDRLRLPPNAFQTVDNAGRPIVAFTVALIASARNADELAFVLGHEAGHHFAGHIDRAQATAQAGAVMADAIAVAQGADAATRRRAQAIGAELGMRSFSQAFELEADAIGTEIAWRAGFDPVRGAKFFDRLSDPGPQDFLSTHPPNAQRQALVAARLAELRGF